MNSLVLHSDVAAPNEPLTILVAGANRGARLMQPTIAHFNDSSDRFELAPHYVDPVPQRAVLLAREGAVRRLRSRGHEARIEEIAEQPAFSRSPLVLNVDDPRAIAHALQSIDLAARSVLLYLFVRMPSNQLVGIRGVLQRGDENVAESGAAFFTKLSEVTARSGAAAVLGHEGRAEHIAIEPMYRAWFASHFEQNIAKIVARTRADSDPFEITPDGRRTVMLMFYRSDGRWADPAALARYVVQVPTNPVQRGRDFAVAEIGADAIRLHTVRVRATDGRVALRGTALINPEEYSSQQERRETLQREAREALERAKREMLSRTRPVYTTD